MIIVSYGIIMAIILAVAAMGGMFSEKSGTVNIAINGMMIAGGLAYWYISKKMPLNGIMQLVGYLIAALTGIVVGLIFGLAAITLKANQVIVGTSINLLLAAVAIFVWKFYGGSTVEDVDPQLPWGFGQDKTKVSYIFGLIFFLGIVLILISWVWIKFTPWGLRLRAAGENPQALDSQGINVTKTKYYGILISGALAAVAGAMYIQTLGSFRGNVAGLGFVALAIMIAGQWNPIFIFFTAIAFGLLYSVGINITVFYPNKKWLSEIEPLIRALPFALSLLALVLTSKNSRAPKAIGVAYDKSKR